MDLHAQLVAQCERARRIKPLADEIIRSRDWRDRLKAIKGYYAAVEPEILAADPWTWALDVYEVDWPRLFSPIESALWCDIRSNGLPFYPQYPIKAKDGRVYFADFANPVRHIALECDGKAFHSDERDRWRDEALNAAGWKVFRFSGSDCFGSEIERELLKIGRAYLAPDAELPARPQRAAHRGFE